MCHVDQTLNPNNSEDYETDEEKSHIRVLHMMKSYSADELSKRQEIWTILRITLSGSSRIAGCTFWCSALRTLDQWGVEDQDIMLVYI